MFELLDFKTSAEESSNEYVLILDFKTSVEESSKANSLTVQ